MSVPVLAADDGTSCGNECVVLIERRTLVRECLANCLQRSSGYAMVPFESVERCLDADVPARLCLIVLCTSGDKDGEASGQIAALAKWAERVPLVLVSDGDDADHILKALETGARGFIPTDLPLAVAGQAIRLVSAGGVFVPASSLRSVRSAGESEEAPQPRVNGLFTTRQSAVVEALRKGKANKIIAYELNMRESTVKVHVRNIMKKLKARNRTEVAYITNGMAAHERAGPSR